VYDHLGDDESTASGDLIANVLFGDLGFYIGDCDMRFVRMGRIHEIHDLTEAPVERMEFWAFNRRDDNGNLSGR
jgi:hypothetical protein